MNILIPRPLASAWHPPRGGFHVDEWVAELIGTAILVFGGLSAVTIDFAAGSPVAQLLPSASIRLLITGALFAGVGVLVTVSWLGQRSGAHLNPAVTVAFWLTGHVHVDDLVGYVVAQCLGAVAGAWLLALAWGDAARSVTDGLTQPGPGVGETLAAVIEAAMTGMLVLTILLFVANRRTMRWTPFAVWVVVTLLVWQGAPLTGTSLNPARSLGPALVTGNFHAFWAYVVGPLGGALGAVLIQRAFLPRAVPLTAALFHLPGPTTRSLGHWLEEATGTG